MSTTSRPLRQGRPAADSLVLDTRSIARTPGAMTQVRRAAVLPSDIGVEMIRIPEGSEAVSYTHLTLPTNREV